MTLFAFGNIVFLKLSDNIANPDFWTVLSYLFIYGTGV
jgi:hypothetical protein